LEAIDSEKIIKTAMRLEKDSLLIKGEKISLSEINRLIVVGVGKCSSDAAFAVEKILGSRISEGIVIDVSCTKSLKKIKPLEGDHPLPTEKNVNFTKQIIELLKGLKENDLVLFIVSGGGSTMLCQPQNFTCQQESGLVDYLIKTGATIQEINTIRKHISLARGGHLAKYAYPARAVSLIFSDVPGDSLEFIASGPTVKDSTTVQDAKKVFEKYKVREKSGFSPKNLIETPKEAKYFENVKNFLMVSNRTALKAMLAKASSLNFSTRIYTDSLTGEARLIGRQIAGDLEKVDGKTALLYGGETTVTVKGKGQGGRNQELALSALKFTNDKDLIISLASDGHDNTDSAGAICDIITKRNAKKLKLDIDKYLNDNDSYHFFKKTEDFIDTGHTGSNVMDLMVALKE
ncbi:MAG: glycerate kinase type-2 family protein, partial [Planctomycetota bacterium]